MVNHIWASTASGGTLRPWPYMPPRLYCARVWPCSAARRYQATASASPASALARGLRGLVRLACVHSVSEHRPNCTPRG